MTPAERDACERWAQALYGPCDVVSIEESERVDHERRKVTTRVRVRVVLRGYTTTFESEIGLAADEAPREGGGGCDGQ